MSDVRTFLNLFCYETKDSCFKKLDVINITSKEKIEGISEHDLNEALKVNPYVKTIIVADTSDYVRASV